MWPGGARLKTVPGIVPGTLRWHATTGHLAQCYQTEAGSTSLQDGFPLAIPVRPCLQSRTRLHTTQAFQLDPAPRWCAFESHRVFGLDAATLVQ
jgi:hypothetical protein